MSVAKELWSIKLIHSYFKQGVSTNIEVIPTNEMLNLMRRRGFIWVKKSINEWALLGFDHVDFDKDDIGTFELKTSNSQIPYITDLDLKWGSECYVIEVKEVNSFFRMNTLSGKVEGRYPGNFCRLKCALGKMLGQSDSNTTTLIFDSKSLYWEFNFIPRDGNMNRNLELEESQRKITFAPCGVVDFMDRGMFRCRSEQKRTITQYSDDNLCLYERINGMRKPLLRCLPVPQPGKFLDSKDTVSAILYF